MLVFFLYFCSVAEDSLTQSANLWFQNLKRNNFVSVWAHETKFSNIIDRTFAIVVHYIYVNRLGQYFPDTVYISCIDTCAPLILLLSV